MGAQGGCYKKETFAWTLRCRADREDARGVSDAIAGLGEGAEDDGARGGKLVQMVHDLDLVTVDRVDVLLAGIRVGVLTRGHARLLSSGFLLMLKRFRDGSISAGLRYVLDCDSDVFRWRDGFVSPFQGFDGRGGAVQ